MILYNLGPRFFLLYLFSELFLGRAIDGIVGVEYAQ